MIRSIFILTFLSIISLAKGQESSVEKDLTFLSSDEMKGRENGSDELLKAANYIAERYKEIGLTSPDFCDNYLQSINLIKVHVKSKNLVLNSYSIPEDNFILLSQSEGIFKNDTTGLTIFKVGENEDIMHTFSQLVNYPRSYIVFVHPIHEKRFERLKRYFRSDKLQVKRDDDYFSLWVKTSESELESIQLNVLNDIESTKIYNVIGELASTKSDDRKWIYSAHYDHIGISRAIEGDSIANGANDDASGVAAVIDLASKFSNGPGLDKSIYFVAFAGEELGLYGSRYMASHVDLTQIEAMINIEMIGEANNDLGPQSAYINGYELSYLPGDLAKNVNMDDFFFFPDPYPNLNLFKRSDNAPFASQGIPAHSISSYNEDDERYHTVNDEIEYLDIEHIQEVIDAIYKASIPLLKSSYSPGMIDGKTKNDR